jgi:D-glycero-D-manno-heptose 1,7-bisphosphate phosphatase
MGIGEPVARPAVFLDRDGVINRAFVREGIPHPPRSLEEVEILPDVPAALNRLKTHGYSLIVVTNQPDVARGSASRKSVERIHGWLESRLPIDAILACFHDDADGCDCRKPKPGLLQRAARAWDLDLSSSFMVGDRWRDVEAGRRAGCRTFFIDRGYRADRGHERSASSCDFRVGSLSEACATILARADCR